MEHNQRPLILICCVTHRAVIAEVFGKLKKIQLQHILAFRVSLARSLSFETKNSRLMTSYYWNPRRVSDWLVNMPSSRIIESNQLIFYELKEPRFEHFFDLYFIQATFFVILRLPFHRESKNMDNNNLIWVSDKNSSFPLSKDIIKQ